MLQVKELSPRPAEYDGLICLGGVPEGTSTAKIKRKLQKFGTIEYCRAPVHTEGIMLHRVKFATHDMAKQAAGKAPELEVCKFSFIAYRDYDLYDIRGW